MVLSVHEAAEFCLLLFILFPFSTSLATNLMINTIQAVSETYYFQYFLILSSRERAQTLHHENLLKELHSRITSSTIVTIHIDELDELDKKGKDFERWNWKKSRSLVIFNGGDSIERKKFVKFSENIDFGSSLIWLIFLNDINQVEEFAKLLVLPFNSQVMLAVLKGSEYVHFKAPYRVANNFPLRIINVGNFSATDGLNLPVIDVTLTRRNMEGIRLKAGIANYPPMSNVFHRKDGKLTSKGFLADIWKVLRERLNFTYDYYLSKDNVTGAPLLNGTWNGLMGMLIRKEIDVAVLHVSITKERMKHIDFAVPVTFNRKKIFYLDLGNQLEWGNWFRPFSVGVWLVLLLWYVVVSIALSYFLKMECLKRVTLCKQECTVAESFLTVFRVITNQANDVTPQSVSSRILFHFVYLTIVVILPSYSAALISYLTIQTPYKPFDSLRSMLEKRTHYLAVMLNTSDHSYFTENSDPLLEDVLQKLIIRLVKKGRNPKNAQEGLELVCHHKNIAFLENYLTGEMFADKLFQEHGCKITSLETAVTNAGESFAFQKGSPYARIFNSELKKIVYRGLSRRLQKQLYLKNEGSQNGSGYEEISLRHVIQIYSLLLGGFILSVLILAVEIYISRRKKFQVTDRRLEKGCSKSKKGNKLKLVTKKRRLKFIIRKSKSKNVKREGNSDFVSKIK